MTHTRHRRRPGHYGDSATSSWHIWALLLQASRLLALHMAGSWQTNNATAQHGLRMLCMHALHGIHNSKCSHYLPMPQLNNRYPCHQDVHKLGL
jgi:hypothetical protein